MDDEVCGFEDWIGGKFSGVFGGSSLKRNLEG